jgi:hypothetical protein
VAAAGQFLVAVVSRTGQETLRLAGSRQAELAARADANHPQR